MTRSLTLAVALWLALSLGLGTVRASAMTTDPDAVRHASVDGHHDTLRAATSRSWAAPSGPFFNDPHLKKGWYRIERKVIDTIRHTRKGATIRIAIYSLDRMPVAKALVDAHRRGVKVQILLNDHWENPAMQVVRAEIGADRSAKSFIYKCNQSCRGAANEFNNLHSKFYSFSQAGKTRHVLAVGSANMTLNADRHQWNDLYFTSGYYELFRQFVGLFNDMRNDYDTRQEPMSFCGIPLGAVCEDSIDKYTAWAFPKQSGPRNDLVLDMLGRIQCLTPDGAGDRRAPDWRCPCTPCGAGAATTWPPRFATSTPRAATSASATDSSATTPRGSSARPRHAGDPAPLHRPGLQHRRQLRPQQ